MGAVWRRSITLRLHSARWLLGQVDPPWRQSGQTRDPWPQLTCTHSCAHACRQYLPWLQPGNEAKRQVWIPWQLCAARH